MSMLAGFYHNLAENEELQKNSIVSIMYGEFLNAVSR